jgi:hypothetical protein
MTTDVDNLKRLAEAVRTDQLMRAAFIESALTYYAVDETKDMISRWASAAWDKGEMLLFTNSQIAFFVAGYQRSASLLSEHAALKQEVERLRGQNAALTKLARRKHTHACWNDPSACTCGASEHNARVAELLSPTGEGEQK